MDNTPIDNKEQAQPKVATAPLSKLVIAAFIITVLAWVSLPLQYVVSMCLSVIGLAFSVVGVRHKHGGTRTLAIVTIVAAAVLMLVYAVFWGALLYVTFSY